MLTQRVCHRPHRQRSSPRMPHQHRFHFQRGDILARSADDILFPVTKEKQAVTVAHHNIARMKPAICPGCLGRHFILQIGVEKPQPRIGTGAPHQQLARRAISNVISGIIDNAGLHVGRRHPETILANHPPVASGSNTDTGPCFSHRPGLDKREPEPRLKCRMKLAIHTGTKPIAYAVRLVPFVFRPLHQNRWHHPQIMQDGGAAFADSPCPAVGVKPVKRHKRAAHGDHRHHRIGQRIHMEHWQRCQHHLGARAQIIGGWQAGIPVTCRQKIHLIELTALWLAGGARCIEQGGLAATGRPGDGRGSFLDSRRGIGWPDDRHFAGLAHLRQHRRGLRGGNHQGHLGMADDKFCLALLQIRVDRHDGQTKRVRRQPVDKEIRCVEQIQANPRADRQTGRSHCIAAGCHLNGHVAIGNIPGRAAIGLRHIRQDPQKCLRRPGVGHRRKTRKNSFVLIQMDRHDGSLARAPAQSKFPQPELRQSI